MQSRFSRSGDVEDKKLKDGENECRDLTWDKVEEVGRA